MVGSVRWADGVDMAIVSRGWAAVLSTLVVSLDAAAASAQQAQPVQLEEVVVETTPVPGAVGVDANKVPALISTVTPKDFEEQHSPTVTDAITQKVPGAIALDRDGSDVSPDLFYRGFDTSHISGTSQGLAVYQNGVRINEAFGDSVNLDLVPPIAIDHADIYTNNPTFGLNALGGAINFTMKNGFNFHGGDATILGGSYGRVNGNFEYGKEVDNYSFYVAGDAIRDSGFRPFSGFDAERAYADLGYRTQDAEVHAIASFGRTFYGALSSTPEVLVDQQYNSVFTNPQTTNNQAELGQLTGKFDLSNHWSLNSNFYIRRFDQAHVDGNDANVVDCSTVDATGAPGTLCLSPDDAPAGTTGAQLTFINPNGTPVPSMGPAGTAMFPYGTTARTQTHTTTIGTQQQVTNRDTFDGHDNYFVAGGSIDYSMTKFASSITLGVLDPQLTNIEAGFPGAGSALQTAGNVGFGPSAVSATAAYYGLYALDTYNFTKEFAMTVGARFNVADVKTNDLTGFNPNLTSSNRYERINPVVGATYEVSKELTIYGGYSEANRAPTPLETSCADPAKPCVLETALASDPSLRQVVSHTIEAGARGTWLLPDDDGAITYKAGYFHTETTDDIISEPSAISGQGFYANVGTTLRQGVEAGATYAKGPFSFYANYAYVDATYEFSQTLSSPNNPFADANGNIFVTPGDHIPGIPRQLGKLGFDYKVTPELTVGMDAVIVGSQYFIGDDSNLNRQLPAYYYLNAHASYQVTDRIQIFGLVRNFSNNHYATYGAFYDTGTDAGLVNPTLGANAAAANPNARTITVAQPISLYGGLKVTF